MIKKTDSLRAGLKPLLAKTLENALAHRIAKEFPRIGGPRICKLCAEMIMELVHNHIRSKDYVHHGQIVWTAVRFCILLSIFPVCWYHIQKVMMISKKLSLRRAY